MPGDGVREHGHRSVLPFRAVPAEVRLLRQVTAAQLGRWGVPYAVEEAELVVTELATNVIKHVGEGATATLVLERNSERLRVEVHDTSRSMPSAVISGCDDECGRGLHLLTALAADWGTALTAVGKSVWCEVALKAEHACLSMQRAVEALAGYREHDGVVLGGRRREADLDESAIELIADLLHWTAARGHDPDGFLDRAQMRYEAEADAA
ncbi:ATP-binding protein [Streptomyces sp. NPDC058848]|uniref:ATP-binding protein n=1 Tax=unclassified Streptomyces TaxID=2593676 RepID=UPI0036C10F21